eukprot:3347749-Amphidinium_carterae.1
MSVSISVNVARVSQAKNNHSIVLAAATQSWEALGHAGPRASNDHAIVMAVVTRNWRVLHHADFC